MMVQKRLSLMRNRGVAILAGTAAFGNRQGKTSAGDLMVSGLVTIMALEVKASHMDITTGRMKI